MVMLSLTAPVSVMEALTTIAQVNATGRLTSTTAQNALVAELVVRGTSVPTNVETARHSMVTTKRGIVTELVTALPTGTDVARALVRQMPLTSNNKFHITFLQWMSCNFRDVYKISFNLFD